MSNPRPIGLSSAMLLAMLAALGSAALVVIGGFANPMSAKSDLIVGGDAGTAQRLSASGAADGAVLTVAGNTVQWATGGSSGPTAGSGTYAARPASPTSGATYTVTSGARRGSVYFAAGGVWNLLRVAPPTGVTPTIQFDGERLGESDGPAWTSEWPAEIGPPAVRPGAGLDSNLVVLASAGGGLPALSVAGGAYLRAPWVGPTGSATRWLAIVASRITSSASYAVLIGWGANSPGAGIWSIATREGGTARWVGWVGSGASSSSSVTPSSGTTPTVILFQYDGSACRLYQDGTQIGTSTPTVATVAGYPLTLGASSNNPAGDYSNGTFHAVLAGSGTLDATARTALQTWAAARFGAP